MPAPAPVCIRPPQVLYVEENDKMSALLDILAAQTEGLVLVFTQTKRGAETYVPVPVRALRARRLRSRPVPTKDPQSRRMPAARSGTASSTSFNAKACP